MKNIVITAHNLDNLLYAFDRIAEKVVKGEEGDKEYEYLCSTQWMILDSMFNDSSKKYSYREYIKSAYDISNHSVDKVIEALKMVDVEVAFV